MSSHDNRRRRLAEHGQTYAAEAGITLRDEPRPLFQLLLLCTLLAKPIGSDLAVAAARELVSSHYRTRQAILAASWQARVDAFTCAHYRRLDENSSTRMERLARWLHDEHGGDLSGFVAELAGEMAERLTAAPGISTPRSSCAKCPHSWRWLRPTPIAES